MNALTPQPRRGLAAALPSASKAIASWLSRDPANEEYLPGADGTVGIMVFRYRSPLTDALVGEAQRLLPVFRIASEAASPGLLARWLTPIALTVRNPLATDEIAGVAELFAPLLSDLPGGCFTAATQRYAAQTFKFWPSPADLAELVRDEAADIRRGISVLSYLASKGKK